MHLNSNSDLCRPTYKTVYTIVSAAILTLLSSSTAANEAVEQSTNSPRSNDTHYTEVGFFDIHVCNWPERELFFMPLFSTSHYREITDITVQYPDGTTMTSLDLKRYKTFKSKGKPKKHVFITQFDVPGSAVDGWYSATVKLADGTQVTAKDYVIISELSRASNMNPPDGAEEITIPKKLTWSGDENSFYQVFIRDVWDDSKLIYKSKLLSKPELVLPDDLLQPDGLYSWQIHARDVNEDILLGDFNKGSMSSIATFSTSGN